MGDKNKANWVWIPSWTDEDRGQARIVLFRKVIKLEASPAEAVFEISADTRYKLYINGKFVEMGPSRGDHQVWFYDTVLATDYFRVGTNVVAVAVLRYPEDPEKGNHAMFRTSAPGLYLSGEVLDVAGNRQAVGTDSPWKCRVERNVAFLREEERFAPLMIHERVLGSPEIFGWMQAGYDDQDWELAKLYAEQQLPKAVNPKNLLPRTIPFLYRTKKAFVSVMDNRKSMYTENIWEQFLSGDGNVQIEVPAGCEEEVVFDAGEEMTGYPHTEFLAGKGARVEFLYAEAYVQDGFTGPGKVPVKADRLDKVHGHLQGYGDVYTVGGFGSAGKPEVYEPYWFRTFRFVRLHISTAAEPLYLRRMDYEETGYPLIAGTSVETSDASLKGIWEISERTLRRCMHESYEDCPYYEQLQYIMDARQQILYTYAISADDRLARKCMDDLSRAQREDGLLNCSYPNCTTNVIPGFSIYYILMVYDHMMYFGDKCLVEKYMPMIERILEFFGTHLSDEGLVEKVGHLNAVTGPWSYIDWAKEWNDTDGMPPAGLKGPLTMESLLYIYGLQHTAKLMEYLGRIDDAGQMRQKAMGVQEAVRKHCIGRDGLLQDGPGVEEYSQHCQVFAFLTDTVDFESGKRNLERTVVEDGYTQCTVAMSFYLFRALEKAGLYAYTDQYWRVWRKMVEWNCTTCVESEAYARSECHGWGALILYELPTVTLGVSPAAPGFQKVRIAPVPGYLTYASGTVRTPGGDIWVSWKTVDGNLQLDYDVPQGLEVITESARSNIL